MIFGGCGKGKLMENHVDREWKTFICYRKAAEGGTPGLRIYSRQLSEELYQCIRDDKKLAPVLHEDCCRGTLISFDEEGIRRIMPKVRYFVPVITPDFFNDIIDRGYLLSGDFQEKEYNDLPICMKEIGHAIVNKCFFFPVYIRSREEEPFFSNREKVKTVAAFLRKIVEYITKATDREDELGACYSQISLIQTRANPMVIRTEDIDLMLRKDDVQAAGEQADKLKKAFDELLVLNETESQTRRDQFVMSLLSDLAMIHQVIKHNGVDLEYRNNIMDTNAYERLALSSKPEYYCISSAFILGVESLRREHDMDSGIGRGFDDVKEACYCDPGDKDYHYWPVTLSSSRKRAENPSFFSVCAICFGAMLLNNWISCDRLLCGETRKESKNTEPDELLKRINNAINLLLSLRDYENMSWVSTWDFGQKVGAIDGTINQTTLSISTLLTCGFLDAESVNNDSRKLLNRIRVIDNSLIWLDSKCKNTFVDGVESYYWGDGCSEEMNLSLTLFCLDTYIKYYSRIKKEEKRFQELEQAKVRGVLYSTYCEDIKNRINGIVLYLNDRVPEIIDASEGNDHDIALIYAKVLKSYCGYISFEKENRTKEKDTRDAVIQAERISCQALTFLYEHRKLVENFTKENCSMLFEEFPHLTYEGDAAGDCDNYDNCAELLFIDAMIKGMELKLYDARTLKTEDLLAGIDEAIRWFRENKVRTPSGEFITVKGHNKALDPPI